MLSDASQAIIAALDPADLQDCYEYLDDLRESGDVNMFGATPYLAANRDLDQRTARAVLAGWMSTFAARHPAGG